MGRLVDFHSHILPCLDDGSSSVEQSIAMLQKEAEQGIDCVVATPHFYPKFDNMSRFLKKREASLQQLREALQDCCDLPELLVGAEVHYFPGISKTEEIKNLAISGTAHILIEMPLAPWTEEMYQELEMISEKRDLIPIVAHIDRYIRPFRTFRIPQRLMQLPVLVQANGEFFLNRRTEAMALRMLREGQIHLLGSDCHNLTTRKPNLEPAVTLIQNRLGEEVLRRIRSTEAAVLRGDQNSIHHTTV